jgi:predicted membrane protein
MIIFGFILWLFGVLLCFTVIGAVIGIPLILIGAGMMVFGFIGRRKTVIKNVITIQNTAPVAPERAAQPSPSSIDSPPTQT